MRFHIAHVLPHERAHGLIGYTEVAQTLRWGLKELGHEASWAFNTIDAGAINIILGVQMLPPEKIDDLPPNSIAYQLEQNRGRDMSSMPSFMRAAERLRFWDYSESNLSWQQITPVYEPVIVPIGWAPVLERIAKPPTQEIDVLFYGMTSPARLEIFHQLSQRGMRAVFASGLYGDARDGLIARAKIVLNLNLYRGRVFEIVRVSYLLANAKAVISDVYPDSAIDPDIEKGVMLVAPAEIPDACDKLLRDDAARMALEQRGQALMRQRDIRPILQRALEASGLAG